MDEEVVLLPDVFQFLFEDGVGSRFGEIRVSAVAGEGEEVEMAFLLKPSKAHRHGSECRRGSR